MTDQAGRAHVSVGNGVMIFINVTGETKGFHEGGFWLKIGQAVFWSIFAFLRRIWAEDGGVKSGHVFWLVAAQVAVPKAWMPAFAGMTRRGWRFGPEGAAVEWPDGVGARSGDNQKFFARFFLKKRSFLPDLARPETA